MSNYPKPGKSNRISLKRRLIAKHGAVCVLCRCVLAPSTLTLDHITPQSRGGKWTLDNLQLLCQPCNFAKADK